MFVFGRGEDTHFCILNDGTISRNHFLIQLSPPECLIMDLNSSNGIVVNGVKYGGRGSPEAPAGEDASKPIRLKDGDEIVAGLTRFVVSIEGGEGPAEEAPAAAEPKPAPDTILAGAGLLGAIKGRSPREVVELTLPDEPPDSADITADLAGPQGAVGAAPADLSVDLPMDLKGSPAPPAIEGYEYVKILGVGGQGSVYLARDVKGGRPVAIKTMLPSIAAMQDAAAKFEREIEVSASIRHPNVVEIFDRGRAGDVFYFVMEYVEGIDIDDLIDLRGGRVPSEESFNVMLQALDGLAHAHGLGYVHRDIKPANILLGGTEPPWTVKIADFGLAKSFEQAGLSGLSMAGDICGSILYMPREQITDYKFVKPSADVYAMGATLYRLLTGKPVRKGFEREIVDTPTAVSVLMGEPVVPIASRDADLPAPVAEVVDRSIADDVSKRYPDAGAMREALAGALPH